MGRKIFTSEQIIGTKFWQARNRWLWYSKEAYFCPEAVRHNKPLHPGDKGISLVPIAMRGKGCFIAA